MDIQTSSAALSAAATTSGNASSLESVAQAKDNEGKGLKIEAVTSSDAPVDGGKVLDLKV